MSVPADDGGFVRDVLGFLLAVYAALVTAAAGITWRKADKAFDLSVLNARDMEYMKASLTEVKELAKHMPVIRADMKRLLNLVSRLEGAKLSAQIHSFRKQGADDERENEDEDSDR